MNTKRPAPLDGSLLARKGAAVPAVPQESPLTQELGEPRPDATVLAFNQTAAMVGEPVRTEAPPPIAAVPSSRRAPVMAGLLVVVAVVIFAALWLLPTADRRVQAPVPPQALPERTVIDAPSEPPAAAGQSAAATDEPRRPAEPAADKAVPEVANVGESAAEDQAIGTGDTVSTSPTPPETVSAPAPPATAAAPLPSRKPDRPPPPIRSGPYVLQLAAFSTAKDARAEAARLQKRLDRALGQRGIVLLKAAGADGKTVYRLRAGGYASLSAARSACRQIRKLKSGCLVVRR